MKLLESLFGTKEGNYLQSVERDLKLQQSEMIRLLHQKALIDAAIDANRAKQARLIECLPVMRQSLEKCHGSEELLPAVQTGAEALAEKISQ